MGRIAVIAVNYRSYDDALHLHTRIQSCIGADVDTIVADNTETPDLGHALYRRAQKEPRLRVFGDGTNRGYLGGAAHALRSAGGPDPYGWVVVCNCDVEPASTDLFARLRALESECENRRVGIVAPSIVSSRSGSDQNPYYPDAPSARKYLALSLLFRSYPLALAYRVAAHLRQSGSERPAAKPGRIYAGHGSFMIFHRGYFSSGATLDYEPLLYCEEVHVAEQAARVGLSVRYDPGLRVRHREHGSTRLIPSPTIIGHLADAHYYAYRHYLKPREAESTSHTVPPFSMKERA